PSSGGEATVGSSHSGPLPPSETNACGQLLLLLSGAEAARAALVEQLTELQGSHEALHQEMEALGSQLQLLRGNPQALAALAMSDLQSLEAELEHTCRCVRATLLQRSTDEAALRASHEK
ncbi:RING-type domain-containing protein, partial [Haematococcus lacustris]